MMYPVEYAIPVLQVVSALSYLGRDGSTFTLCVARSPVTDSIRTPEILRYPDAADSFPEIIVRRVVVREEAPDILRLECQLLTDDPNRYIHKDFLYEGSVVYYPTYNHEFVFE